MELNLDQIKLKTTDELEDNEKQFLTEHISELNDEDKAAYADFLPKEEEPPKTPEDTTPPPVTNTTPPAQTPPVETVTFKTKAELDAYIAENVKANIPKPPPEPPKPAEFFKEGELPKDWNEALGKAVDVAVDKAVGKVKELTESEKAELAKMEEAIAKTKASFEAEFKQLATEGKLPKEDTPEFAKARDQIYDIGSKNGKSTIADAFDLWSKIPEQFGGGFKIADQKSQQLNAQKKAAAMVGGGSGGGSTATTPTLDYKTLHSKSLDDLIDAKLQ